MSRNFFTAPRLTSGDQTVVSLVNGFGYTGGATPAVFKQYDFAILNTSFTVLAWRFEVHVNGAFIAGVAGPGWGTGTFDNELYIGDTPDDRSIMLGGGAPYTEAGFLFGAALKFAIRVKISGWRGVRWVGGWHGHFENIWSTLTDVSEEVQLDLIKLVVAAITKLVERGQGGPLSDITKKLKPAESKTKANWSLIDTTTSAIQPATAGPTSLLPQLAVRVDLSQFIPPLRTFNDVLSKVGSSVTFGPTFGIGFPIRIQVEGIVLDNGVYQVTGSHNANALTYYDSNQNSLLSGSAPAGINTAAYRPSKVGLRYKWSWGIDLTVGVFCSINIFWVLSINPEYHFGLLSLLGLSPTGPTYRGDLTNRSFTYQSQVTQRDLPQPVEVVFEDPVDAWT